MAAETLELLWEAYALYDDIGYDWWCVGIWYRSDGALFIARDGGCSCNSPWDDELDLTPLRVDTLHSVVRDHLDGPDAVEAIRFATELLAAKSATELLRAL